MNKKKTFATGAALLMAFTFALGSSNAEEQTPEKVENSSASKKENSKASSEEKAVKEKVFKMGETVKMGDFNITVNSVREEKLGQYDFSMADEGEKIVLVDVSIQNNSKESVDVSSMLMFKMSDKDGYSKDLAISTNAKGSLDGELGAGRTMRGELPFSVGSKEKSWELIFEPDFLAKGQAIFKVNLK